MKQQHEPISDDDARTLQDATDELTRDLATRARARVREVSICAECGLVNAPFRRGYPLDRCVACEGRVTFHAVTLPECPSCKAPLPAGYVGRRDAINRCRHKRHCTTVPDCRTPIAVHLTGKPKEGACWEHRDQAYSYNRGFA